MKVTDVPAQAGLVPSVIAMEMDGESVGFTVMVIEFELAVAGLAQDELDVITQLTTSLLAKEDEV